uniref:PhaZ n=1 Tax=Pseudomonas luteola TaxID=47886 RepID=Q5U7P0_PSELU|nr:PhaZ [Pseudomonas luteola]
MPSEGGGGVIIILSLTAIAGTAPALAASPCTERAKSLLLPGKISCSYRSTWIPSSSISNRKVIYQLPSGTAPTGGWPVVLIYQGSFFPLNNFTYYTTDPFGGYYEGRVVKTLLENGYAVIAPSAPADLFWHTNLPALASNYELSTDYTFLTNVFQAIDDGDFGPLNGNRKYATGISSGGYNTSRMAVSFPGEFKALAVQSGSYATCSGPVCSVPDELPADHPPTYFLHGFVDLTVPWWSMDMYYDRLLYQNIPTGRYTKTTGGHEWFPASAAKVLAWFNAYP